MKDVRFSTQVDWLWLWFPVYVVLERPSSQMSYLEQFLKETNSPSVQNMYDNVQPQAQPFPGGSLESEDGDIEDNRAPSVVSSKSNLSEVSMVGWASFWFFALVDADLFHSFCRPTRQWSTRLISS